MPQLITVTKPSGTTVKLGTSHPAVPILSAYQEMSLMEDDKVLISCESPSALNIGVGDYISVFGRRYFINNPPVVTKSGNRNYVYELTFEGVMYEMAKAQHTFYSTGFTETTDFTLMANQSGFAASILHSLQRLTTLTWGASAPSTPVVNKNLTFSAETCLEVVNRIADEFEYEWYLQAVSATSYTLVFTTKAGTDLHTTDIFYLGRGIRSIKRTVVNSKPFCTRLYVMGSDKNIPSNYRSYSQRLLPTGSLNYIENATAKAAYGLIEASKIWEDIFPTREGTVSSLGADEKTFLDSGMDFDVNSYLLAGLTAKVHFQTGKLAGYEFPLKSYTHATKTFVINSITDERGLTVPNSTATEFQIAAGDTYKLIDIQLPAGYITTAENTLLSTATAWLNLNCNPIVQYELEMDEQWIAANMHGRTENNLYAPGDIIHINDAGLNINNDIRILGFKRNILRPYDYTFQLGDAPYRKPAYRVISQLRNVVKNQSLAAIDDPAVVRLKLWGENYAQSQASDAE